MRLVLLRRQALAAMLCAKDERVINNVRLRAGPDWNAQVFTSLTSLQVRQRAVLLIACNVTYLVLTYHH